MSQTRWMSVTETTLNIGSGMVIAWGLTYYVLPAVWGLTPSAGAAVEITALYTGVSWIRSYTWRRIFANRLHRILTQLS